MTFIRWTFIIVLFVGITSSRNEAALAIANEEQEVTSTTDSMGGSTTLRPTWMDLIGEVINATENGMETASDIDETTMNSNDTTKESETFMNGFFSSFFMILMNEVCDKTFFISVVLAMRHSRLAVYLGALSCLALMTALATTIGILTSYIPKSIVIYSSSAVMLMFGLKMIYDAFRMTPQAGKEEFEEVEMQVELRERGGEVGDALIEEPTATAPVSHEQPSDEPEPNATTTVRDFVKVCAESFALTFVAEWGDRSQISTALLAATENAWGVLAGGIFGHSIVSGAAVLGGMFFSKHISARAVTIIGGISFLVFSFYTIIHHYLNSNV